MKRSSVVVILVFCSVNCGDQQPSQGFAASDEYIELAPTAPGGGVAAHYVTMLSQPDHIEHQIPIELKLAPSGIGDGDLMLLAQSRYVFANPNGPVSLLRNTSAGYVIGSALNGWTFDVVNKGSGNWYRGTIYGSYNNCGFALAANIDPKTGTPHSACDVNWQVPITSFASAVNCSGCGGGRAVWLTGGVNRFLNVQALNGGNGPFTENQGQLYPPTCVEWRYVTLNGQWVLAKWRGADDNHGSWAFMERASFPATLPTGIAACP